ncbi:related to triacylglycerol lipase V precursor [Lecanosticta acicola]|uniref:Carboxylic ester hydrolase n=1 Tax=Lecanosticta acicola TaxID=111012 RepID=A0AAI8YX54_9PEZI|nr:related to triacylglycerol lipase V precursor [Lecanosticta acicola]
MYLLPVFASSIASTSAWSPWWHHHGQEGDDLNLATTSGHIQGKVDPAYPSVRQFLGIPYAKPPIGDLRWTAPQTLSQPNAQVEATELPPSCNQFLSNTGDSLYTRDVLQFNLQGLNITGKTSEDCLTASVWTPAQKRSGRGWWKRGIKENFLPVLIFFYGGGFSTGGEDVPYQIPTQWVNRSPNHIVVSFNYRLNIFGFPGALGLKDQNLGLLDQRLAVEWVKENIAAFGGDSERMVIWGQSAGAASIDYYNYAYPDDPIVTGLIMDSGTALLPTSVNLTGESFAYVASQVGCGGLANDPVTQLACMRKVTASTIENFVANHSDSGASPSLSFQPTVDGKVIFANYTDRALAGKQAKIPAIIGTNLDDGVAFAPYNPDGPNQTVAHQALLNTFFCPATETVRLRQQTGRQTYSYRYSGNFTNISPRSWMGAYHSSELPLIFGTHLDYRVHSSALEYETSRAMQDAWVAFASDPIRGLESQDWPVYEQLGLQEVREFRAGIPAGDISVANVEAQCNGAVAEGFVIIDHDRTKEHQQE